MQDADFDYPAMATSNDLRKAMVSGADLEFITSRPTTALTVNCEWQTMNEKMIDDRDDDEWDGEVAEDWDVEDEAVDPFISPKLLERFFDPFAGKIGRNDPCPCGSGNKYKKCHGAG